MYKFIFLLFISSFLLANERNFIPYPINEKYLTKPIKLKGVYGLEHKYGRPTYQTDYKAFFKKCEYRDFEKDDKEKLNHHYEVYGELLEKLKNYKKFYVTYYRNVTLELYDEKSLLVRYLKTRFEIFLNKNKEIIFYSKISRVGSGNPPLKYINLSLFFNIVIYLHKNNIPFTLNDIKENNHNMIFKDKDFQKTYDNHEKDIDGYIVLVNYDFYEKDFKVKRTFGVVIERSTRSISYLYIKDIFINKNLIK